MSFQRMESLGVPSNAIEKSPVAKKPPVSIGETISRISVCAFFRFYMPADSAFLHLLREKIAGRMERKRNRDRMEPRGL